MAYGRGFLILLVVGYFVACSPVNFSREPAPACQGQGVTTCSSSGGLDKFQYTQVIGEGGVDFIFVVDNSGSMSTEHRRIANSFSGFIQSLGNLDYRIMMTTTDVSGVATDPLDADGSPNMSASLRDGAFLKFPDGRYYLDKQAGVNQDAYFRQTIERQETLNCENSNYASGQCPSSDERGIYAANLAMDRNDNGAIRSGANIKQFWVFLADEDARSSHYRYAGDPDGHEPQSYIDEIRAKFALVDYDQPASFKNRILQKYANKSVSVNSIIVRPGDATCESAQTNQGNGRVTGSQGLKYAELADIMGGVKGDICASDYTSQMQAIGNLALAATPTPVHCSNPKITVEPANIQWHFDNTNRVVQYTGSIPAGTKITTHISCKTLQN